MDENFIVDFGEVTRVVTEDFNKLNNRPSYAGELMTGDTNIPQVPSSVSELNNDSNYQTGTQVGEAIGAETEAREAADTALDGRLTTVEGIAATALQPSSIDKVVMTDINVGANTSTTTFNLDASKQNLLTGATSSKQVSMPVASSTEAGIMNPATFDAVMDNTAHINALTNGAVAITGLPSSPTQAQLTTAWENATGETSLMNRAGIYDVTNGKVWTYYTNDTTWHSTTNTTQVTINTFTNSSEGTIKGSTNVGQIFAEADGTGSVNGWDALNDAVENNSSDISDLQTAVDGKQDKLIAGANINIAADGKTISATDTTYTAGNAIDITNGEISADIHPADFFTASDSVSDCGSNLSLDNTIASTLKSVELKGDTYQQAYSGKKLVNWTIFSASGSGINYTSNNNGSITANGVADVTYPNITNRPEVNLPPGTYTVSIGNAIPFPVRVAGTYEGASRTGLVIIPIGSTSATFTTTETLVEIDLWFDANIGDTVNFTIYPMLEGGSTATAYEPFVGGIPAPNPDYPQDIQVVTGEQTVEMYGKNLFNPDAPFTFSGDLNLTKTIIPTGVRMTCDTTNTSSSAYGFGVFVIGKLSNYIGKKVTLTTNATTSTTNKSAVYIGTCDANGGNRSAKISQNGTTGNYNFSISWDVVEDTNQYLCVALYSTLNTAITAGDYVDYKNLQLETGTATPYEAYATPQSYTVDLSSIELCKIGDYQDYIYKSGDDWYVHKAMGRIMLDGSETWSATQMTNNWMYYTTNAGMTVVTSSQMPDIISNYFSVATTDGQWTSIAGSKSVTLNNTASPNTQIRFTVGDNTNKLADFKTWLSTHNTIVYYPLATPTDTQITDTSLVAQLNALAGAKSYNGQTNVVVTAAGENLPALLCVKAYQKSLNGLLGAIERLGA